MVKEQVELVKKSLADGKIQTDSDIEALVDSFNEPLKDWDTEIESTEGFFNSEKFIAYLNNPKRVGFDDIIRVMRNEDPTCIRCHGCKYIHLMGGGPCASCTRNKPPLSDNFEQDSLYS